MPPDALPLSALRAFEAASRCASMSAAAAELNVTHGAVSRQIASLERQVGAALFDRGARGIRLTATGARLFHEVHDAFERMRSALDGRVDVERPPVSLTTLPSFAKAWLMPRLVEFGNAHPGITVRVHTGLAVEDLREPRFDLAIRYGSGVWKGTAAEPLLGVSAFPVCSPGYLAKVGPLSTPADLLRFPLIHDSGTEWWSDWFRSHGVTQSVPAGIVVEDYSLALEFALDGRGMALGRSVLVAADLECDRLVRPLGKAVRPRLGYHLVRAAGRPLGEEVRHFADWLRKTALEDKA